MGKELEVASLRVALGGGDPHGRPSGSGAFPKLADHSEGTSRFNRVIGERFEERANSFRFLPHTPHRYESEN